MHPTANHLLRTAVPGLLLVATIGTGTAAAAPAAPTPGHAAPPAASVECLEARVAARETPTVDELRELGFCEIDRRLATLEKLQAAIDRSPALTDDHEAALERILAGTRSGLGDLRAEIAAGSTVAALREDVRRIATDFRVYVLVARQVRLVIGSDLVAAGVAKAEAGASRIEAAIESAEAAGKNATAARAHLAAMTRAIEAAAAAIEGDAGAVLGQRPAGWNAGDAKPVLDAARASLKDARSQLRVAVREARSALADLR